MAPTASRQALIGAGANLGDRLATLDAAIDRLRNTAGVTNVVTSSVFETEPVGLTEQPQFLNLAVGVETSLSPEELLGALQQIEQAFGRVRTQRWGPRTLDLDLLAFEGETRATAALHLPHPRMLERGFVTVPLRDLLERTPLRENKAWSSMRQEIARAAAVQGHGVRPFAVR